MRLIIASGPNKGTVFDVPEATCTIGRAHGNRVVLYDRRVSTRHAVVERAGDEATLRDLGSSNGTYVNGLLVASAPLRPGDTVQLGDTVLAFERLVQREEGEAPFRVVRDGAEGTSSIRATVSKKDSSSIVDPRATAADVASLRDDRRKLLGLYRVNNVINSVADAHELLCRVLEEVFDVLRADRGFIMLLDEKTGELIPAAMRRRHAADTAEQVTISRTIARQVLEEGEAVLSADAGGTKVSEEIFGDSLGYFGFQPVAPLGPTHWPDASATGVPHPTPPPAGEGEARSAMCAPLHGREGPQGILYLDNAAANAFSARDLQLLTAMANQLGIALENMRLAEARLAGERFAAIGQAVAGLSHYIKNILGCMQGGAQIVQRGLDADDRELLRRGWDILRRNERKISELVLDMLNYSGASEPLLEPCQANDLVEEVAEAVGAEAEKPFRVERDLAPDLPTAQLDSTAIHRCLLDLLSNAIEALPESGGVIRFVTRYDAGANAIRLSVAENGCGIEPDLLLRVFDVFVTTKGAKGTGLGLAVVDKLVKEHGGRVEVVSQPGRGSTFTLVLPVQPQQD